MMYYVILAVIAIILFLLRKRILGGIVGAVTLMFVAAFVIFLLDFFWLGTGFMGFERDVRNFEPAEELVSKYDDTVKDPKKVAKDISDKVKEKGTEVNKDLEDKGEDLDNKLGINKNEKNNNLWEEGEPEELEEGERDKEQEVRKDKNKDEGIIDKIVEKFSSSEEKEEKVLESTNKEKEIRDKGLIPFKELSRVKDEWGLTDKDYKFVKVASPFNKGKFSNGSIEIEVEDGGVRLLGGGE